MASGLNLDAQRMGNANFGLDDTLLDYYETQTYLSRATIVGLFRRFCAMPGTGASQFCVCLFVMIIDDDGDNENKPVHDVLESE